MPDDTRVDEAILRFLGRTDATQLSDGKILAVEDVVGAHHLRVDSRHGVVDIVRDGVPPLDYETVAAQAVEGSWRGSRFRVGEERVRFPPGALAG